MKAQVSVRLDDKTHMDLVIVNALYNLAVAFVFTGLVCVAAYHFGEAPPEHSPEVTKCTPLT